MMGFRSQNLDLSLELRLGFKPSGLDLSLNQGEGVEGDGEKIVPYEKA